MRVSGISPGPILGTEGIARFVPDTPEHHANFERIPLKRCGEIDEVAEAAMFFSSRSAAYVTGTILDVDGGSQLGDVNRVNLEMGLP